MTEINEEHKTRVLDCIAELVKQPRMQCREGDADGTKPRPTNGFSAYELYSNPRLGLTDRQVFEILNSMATPRGRLKIKNLVYFLRR